MFITRDALPSLISGTTPYKEHIAHRTQTCPSYVPRVATGRKIRTPLDLINTSFASNADRFAYPARETFVYDLDYNLIIRSKVRSARHRKPTHLVARMDLHNPANILETTLLVGSIDFNSVDSNVTFNSFIHNQCK